MSYHINFQGEVHPCTAQIKCRFGDFDTDHYTTAEQARAAYEAAQTGKTMASFTKRDSFFAVKHRSQRKAEKEQRRLHKFLQGLRPLDTPVPPEPEPGYWLAIDRSTSLTYGAILSDGSRVLKVEAKEGVGRTVTTNFGAFTVTQADLAEGKLWVEDRPSPEHTMVRSDFLRERTLEDGYKNFTRIPFRHSSSHHNFEDFAALRRRYREIVKRNLKAGAHLPYTRAYIEMYGKGSTSLGKQGEILFRWAMNAGNETLDREVLKTTLQDSMRGWMMTDNRLAPMLKDCTGLEYSPGVDLSWEDLADLRKEV